MLKIICIKNFHVDKFSRFRSILDIFCIKCFIRVLNFRGWSQLRNYFNSEIFPIYGSLHMCHSFYVFDLKNIEMEFSDYRIARNIGGL